MKNTFIEVQEEEEEEDEVAVEGPTLRRTKSMPVDSAVDRGAENL